MTDRVLVWAEKQRQTWQNELANLERGRKTTVEVKDDGSRGVDDTANTTAEISELLTMLEFLIFRHQHKAQRQPEAQKRTYRPPDRKGLATLHAEIAKKSAD